MGKTENLIKKQEKDFKVLRSYMDSAAEMLGMTLENLKSTHSVIMDEDQIEKDKIKTFEEYKERYNEMVTNVENAFRILSFSEKKVKKEETKLDLKLPPKPVKKTVTKEVFKFQTPSEITPCYSFQSKDKVSSNSLVLPSQISKNDDISKKVVDKIPEPAVMSNNKTLEEQNVNSRTLNVDNSKVLTIDNSRTLNIDNSRTLNIDNSRTFNIDNSRTLNNYNALNLQMWSMPQQNYQQWMMPTGFGVSASKGCSCRTGCDTRRCGCVKRGERCSVNCHIGNSYCHN